DHQYLEQVATSSPITEIVDAAIVGLRHDVLEKELLKLAREPGRINTERCYGQYSTNEQYSEQVSSLSCESKPHRPFGRGSKSCALSDEGHDTTYEPRSINSECQNRPHKIRS